MSSVKKRVAGVGAAASLLLSVGVVFASPAAAAECQTGPIGSLGGYSYCTGLATHRVVLECSNGANKFKTYGPWVGSGKRSEAYCSTTGTAGVVGIGVKFT
ncbi:MULTISPECIES: hypothetical protein [unclassified Streptomyces]|uniref:hypothetical protein n=1 Tax=unclassified Streptomyces TaxID=2593676 RepID=UPI0036457B4D